VRGDEAASHRAQQSIARQVAPDRVARDAARGASGGEQVGQRAAAFTQHAAARIDGQASLGVEQRAGHLDGVQRRHQRGAG